MRILFDTNVLVAAFTSNGACHDLVEHCSSHHAVVVTRFVLDEFSRSLKRKFGLSPEDSDMALEVLLTKAVFVEAEDAGIRVCRDPDDDNILAGAVAGACDCIVTGDKDLLCLGEYEGIAILSPGDFWRYETPTPQEQEQQ